MKPNIMLIYPNIFVNGGAERQMAEMCNYLTDRDYRVTIMTVSAIPEFKRSLKDTRLYEAKDVNSLARAVKAYHTKFNIVNSHNHPAELFLYPIQHNHVWQCNEPPTEVLKTGKINVIERDAVKDSVKRAVVISDYDKARFEGIYGFSPIVNYPGINYDYWSTKPSEIPDRYNLKGKFVLTEAGYIVWTKNQVKAVEILAEVKKTIKNACLVLAGYDKDPYINEVKRKVSDLGLVDDVIFTGYIQRDDALRDLFYQTDIHIAPVLDQGGWAVIFQAMAAGIPTVTSDKFVAANLIVNNKLGRVAQIDMFTNEVLDVYNKIDKEVELVKSKSNWIKNNLTWKAFGRRYESIFEEFA